jgi:opacity protein-like surface antigen
MKKFLVVLAIVLFTATAVFAADVSGTWEAKVEVGGQSGTPTFVLKQAGEDLTGTYSGALGEAPLTGTVKGNDVALDFEVSGYKIHYAGKLAAGGKTMEGTVDYGGMASGTFTATKQAAQENK